MIACKIATKIHSKYYSKVDLKYKKHQCFQLASRSFYYFNVFFNQNSCSSQQFVTKLIINIIIIITLFSVDFHITITM